MYDSRTRNFDALFSDGGILIQSEGIVNLRARDVSTAVTDL